MNFEYGQLFHAGTNASRICCRRCFPDSRERDFQGGSRPRGEGEGEDWMERTREKEKEGEEERK